MRTSPQARHPAARRARIDALVDVIVRKYAPLPATTLSTLIRRLRYAVPQHREELGDAVERAKARLAHARVDGRDWYWPADEDPRAADHEARDAVRLLAPFDPIAWDRLRFELLWGWAYRFEAYTPAPKRKLGYYALPLIWRDRAIGWANLAVERGRLRPTFGHVDRTPAERPAVQARAGGRARRRCAASWRSDAAHRDSSNKRAIARGSHQAATTSGFWRQAISEPAASTAAETTNPRTRPPAPSATQPTRLGPTICPAAKTIVKAPMPPAQAAGGRLCRTSAVVEATTDRKTLPNSAPDANTASGCALSTGSAVATASKRIQQAERAAAAAALQQPGPQPRRRDHAEAEHDVEAGDRCRAHPLLAQQRDHEGHVADVAERRTGSSRRGPARTAPSETGAASPLPPAMPPGARVGARIAGVASSATTPSAIQAPCQACGTGRAASGSTSSAETMMPSPVPP